MTIQISRMKYIGLILTVLILLSCGQTETKKVITTFKDGKPEIIYYYPNNSDTLTYRKEVFYNSGKYEYIGNIVNGKKDGVWTWWYENGNKKDQCKYVDGFYVDSVFHWFENGQLKQIEIVAGRTVRTDGCCNCNGTIIRYYENGKPKEKFTSINDKIQGVYTTYDEDGGWKIRTYKDDSLWGPTTEHIIDSKKVIIAVGQYENGKETGLWKWFNKDSILTQTAVYVNGETNGEYIQYYENGKIKEQGFVNNGDYIGELKYFDESGKLTKSEYYKDGKLLRQKEY
jgi:antitoxin component YwqK of YwqJK toxin-antitoxin module